MKIIAIDVELKFPENSGIAVKHQKDILCEDVIFQAAKERCDGIFIGLNKKDMIKNLKIIEGLRSNKIKKPIIGIWKGQISPSEEEKIKFLRVGGNYLVEHHLATPRLLIAYLLSACQQKTRTMDFKHGEAVVVFDFDTELVTVNGKPVHLSPKETEVFFLLAQDKNVIQPRSKIMASLYCSLHNRPNTNLVSVYACNIRKKLRNVHPNAGKILQNVDSRGYRLRSD